MEVILERMPSDFAWNFSLSPPAVICLISLSSCIYIAKEFKNGELLAQAGGSPN